MAHPANRQYLAWFFPNVGFVIGLQMEFQSRPDMLDNAKKLEELYTLQYAMDNSFFISILIFQFHLMHSSTKQAANKKYQQFFGSKMENFRKQLKTLQLFFYM